MFYQKSNTFVLTGNCGISADLKTQYALTLCFSLTYSSCSDTKFSKHNFFDISLSEEQLKDLHAKLSFHLRRLQEESNNEEKSNL